MNARLLNTIKKNNKKNNDKNKDIISKALKEFLVSETLLSVIWLKYFFFTFWREIAFFITFYKFSLLEQSTNTLQLKTFSGKSHKVKTLSYHVLMVFEGNLKNICQKAIKKHLILSSQYIFSFLTKVTSNVRMFPYHVIKLNELWK